MSKGHACPVWYAALAERGFFPVKDLRRLRQSDSHLQGHPDMRKTPGIDMTSGPLGSGLAAGVGIAEAAKITGREYRTYVLLGEGDLQEGATWEALLFAGHHRLDNLTVLIDYNRSQVDGRSDDILSLEPLRDKLTACNWTVREIDGRAMCEIVEALAWARDAGGPTAIIAHTVKGWPVSFMLDNPEWHGKAPNREQAIAALQELGEAWAPPIAATVAMAATGSQMTSPQVPVPAKRSQREAFGRELVRIGEETESLVVLDADISSSLKTGAFRKRFPERHINFGVAEQDMLLAVAGMASTGLISVACTYATFATLPRMRANSQFHLLRQVERQGRMFARRPRGGLGRTHAPGHRRFRHHARPAQHDGHRACRRGLSTVPVAPGRKPGRSRVLPHGTQPDARGLRSRAVLRAG